MFGLVSAVAVLLVTFLYAVCLCIHYRSSSTLAVILLADPEKCYSGKRGL